MLSHYLEAEFQVVKSLSVAAVQDKAALVALPQILTSLRMIRDELLLNPEARQELMVTKLVSILKNTPDERVRGALVDTLCSLGELPELTYAAIKPLVAVMAEPPSETQQLARDEIPLIAQGQAFEWNKKLGQIFAQEAMAQGVSDDVIKTVQAEAASLINLSQRPIYRPVFSEQAPSEPLPC